MSTDRHASLLDYCSGGTTFLPQARLPYLLMTRLFGGFGFDYAQLSWDHWLLLDVGDISCHFVILLIVADVVLRQ